MVENRTGAGGTIAAEAVARSPADGHTLVMGSVGTHAVNATLLAKLPYDPVRDFSPIALVLEAEGLLACSRRPARPRTSCGAGTPRSPSGPLW